MKRKKIKRGDLRPGDVFSLECGPDRFAYGVIVSRIYAGHVAELFNSLGPGPEIPTDLASQPRLFPPVVLDTFSLLEKAVEGNWQLVGSVPAYVPDDRLRDFKFAWGVKGKQSVTDIRDHSEKVSDEEAARWPRCSPSGDWDVKNYLKQQGLDVGDLA